MNIRYLLNNRAINWLINKSKKNPGLHMRGFLRRYYLFMTKHFSIVINHIRRPDTGQGQYHNHPYHFISIVLKGGYTEILWRGDKVETINRGTGDINFRFKSDRHRITKLDGDVWTLFIRFGSSTGEWGLYKDNGEYTPMKGSDLYSVKGQIERRKKELGV